MQMMVNQMISIMSKQDCTGCYACSNICPVYAITMDVDDEGFWYPVVDRTKCIQCGLCTAACPTEKETSEESLSESLVEAYAAYSLDEHLRLQSSSGGLFSILAKTVINNGGVVFGARFDSNFNVVHDYVETIEYLSRLRGSKYVQSKIGDTYKQAQEFLERGRQVMFTGTPCQISGLKHYLGREYENLICQDIICYGVPSPKVWARYLNYRENIAASTIEKIAFRQKNNGWKQYSVSFRFKNGTEYIQLHYNDLYMKAFLSGICLRPSCYACRFKSIYRESDITLADFWGIKIMVPEMYDDKGTSLVVVHTKKGYKLFNGVKDKLKLRLVDIRCATKYNPAMINPAKMNSHRKVFLSSLDDEKLNILVKKYCEERLFALLKRKLLSKTKCILQALKLIE